MENASKQTRRRWYRRPSRIIPVVFAVALAIGVPVAWATFIDVPPSNPFYADINAIQGAGVTQGCGGGNFCPTDNITRQAEAAFVHRAAGRAGVGFANGVTVTSGGVDLGDLTMSIGGVSGQTQFVLLTAQVDTQIQSLSGCPCRTVFGVYSDSIADYVAFGASMNDSVPAGDGLGIQSATAANVIPVPTGTTQTFHIFAFLAAGTGTVIGYGTLNAITAPFGSTGANTLGAQSSALTHRFGRTLPAPPK